MSEIADLFQEYAELGGAVQRRIIEIDNRPARAKRLRRFSLREAARYLGLDEPALRRRLQDPDAPQGERAGLTGRTFALGEIGALRRHLRDATGEPCLAPGRGTGEGLQVVALSNFKGGAAKTTTALHLAQYLALRGYAVLLVDLDSQASATAALGLGPDDDVGADGTLHPYFAGRIDTLAPLVRPTYWPGLDLIPANLGLYRVELELPLRQREEPGFRFWRLLEQGLATVAGRYDVVVCDCPPSLGYLSLNALFAATGLVVPAPPSMPDFASTARFFQMMADTLRDVAAFEGEAKRLDFVRILITKLNTADRNHRRIAGWMESTFAGRVLKERMAATTALDMAGNVKRTLYELEPGPGSRRSFERALDYMDGVNGAIEGLLRAAWGREGAA